MTRVYRILRHQFSKTPFDGEGAYRFGGRWSSPGTRTAYASEHLSLAMLEYFVHTDPANLPNDLVVVTADIPDSVPRTRITTKQLPPNWRDYPAPPELAAIGDDFVRQGRTAVLIVPSTLAPIESNWLINPFHPGFSRIRVNAPEPFEYDTRFQRE